MNVFKRIGLCTLLIGTTACVNPAPERPLTTTNQQTSVLKQSAAQMQTDQNKTMSNFSLIILSGTLDSLKLGYSLKQSFDILSNASTADATISLASTDIEAYSWSKQVFTLTQSASTAVLVALKAAPEASADLALDHRAFVVALDGTPVYGGVFLQLGSPLALKYPVIYAQYIDTRFVFAVRPVHSVLQDYSKIPVDWNGIKSEQLKQALADAGKLLE
jgi:hypothetical protein